MTKNLRFSLTIGIAKPSTSSPVALDDYEAADDEYTYNDDEESKTDTDRVHNNGINFGKPIVPHFDVTDYSLEVKSGEKASLECPVKNLGGKMIFLKSINQLLDNFLLFTISDRDAVLWYHQVTLISQGADRILNDDRITIGPNFTLNITNVRFNDQGQYRCVVLPSNVEMHATLSLAGSPKPITHHHVVNTMVGDDAELHCSYKSPHADKVVWRRNGTALDVQNASKYSLHSDHKHANGHFSNKLVVKNVITSDLGEYVCEVHNDIGTGSVNIQLVETPEPPKYVSTEFGDGAVSNHWTVRSHQPLIEVQLNYRQSGVSLLDNLLLIG